MVSEHPCSCLVDKGSRPCSRGVLRREKAEARPARSVAAAKCVRSSIFLGARVMRGSFPDLCFLVLPPRKPEVPGSKEDCIFTHKKPVGPSSSAPAPGDTVKAGVTCRRTLGDGARSFCGSCRTAPVCGRGGTRCCPGQTSPLRTSGLLMPRVHESAQGAVSPPAPGVSPSDVPRVPATRHLVTQPARNLSRNSGRRTRDNVPFPDNVSVLQRAHLYLAKGRHADLSLLIPRTR